jgi:hypothetical protein
VKRSSSPIRALLVLAIALILFGAVTAAAQPLNWSCATTNIYNYTGCTIDFNLVTDPGGAFTPIAGIAPCNTILGANTAGVMRIRGVTSLAGTFVGMIQPAPQVPAIPPPCGPIPIPANFPDGWVRGVRLGPSPGCCVNIYFFNHTNLPACEIYIVPAPPMPCVP